MTVKNYVLDINKTSLQHPSIVLRQDDYNIYTVNISVTDNGTPVDLGSYTLNFLGITPAGAKIIDSKNFITNAGDLKNGKFSYRFPKEAAGSKGVYDVAYFRLKTTSGATSTIDLNLRVLGGINLTADDVKDYITVDNTLRNTLVAEVFKKIDAKVDQHLATVKKGDKGDKGNPGKDAEMPVVGGRNLLIGTADYSGSAWMLSGNVINQDFQGLASDANNIYGRPKYSDSTLESQGKVVSTGTNYVMSSWVNNTGTSDIDVIFQSLDVSPRNYIVTTLPAKSGWVHIASKPFNFIKTSGNSDYLRFESETTIPEGTLRQAGLKLEIGNVATDWTPAPEDVQSDISKRAIDTSVVHNTGNETVAGNKTLTGLTTILTGNYGLKVTSSGFQKTTDGGKTWVTANL